ncbi:MAG: MazG family protein [Deinococcota bacterium]
MNQLLEVMRRLRGPGGCPWDQEQTHASLRPYLLEEACEAIDAISDMVNGGSAEAVTEELGDVLLQVAFHAVIAEAEGSFKYNDIETAIVDKLIRRHPHVFAEVEVTGADDVVRNWQAIKAEEKGTQVQAPEDAVPRSLPALARASELGRKLEWPTLSFDDIQTQYLTDGLATHDALESGDPLISQMQVGQLLLLVTDYARKLDVNPEIALREATQARLEQAKAQTKLRRKPSNITQ